MATLQVKGIDNQLYEALKRRAELDHRSISQEVIRIIQYYLARSAQEAEDVTYEFLKLSGAWTSSEPAKKIIDFIRKSRKHHSKETFLKNVFD